VLLRRGAEKVYAVDVGRAQLHPRIAANRRVVSLETIDARSLTTAQIAEPIDLLVADVSFISLKLVLPSAVAFLKEHGALVALVKPQFEAGRAEVKGGVVRDQAVHLRVLRQTAGRAVGEGLEPVDAIASPILGPEGNREFLLWLRVPSRHAEPAGPEERERVTNVELDRRFVDLAGVAA
jgi:23S rRNA (cytidine1920-2'-O)/16S rRNA (cytidine1409-2'-O)-methyltransferase